MHMSRKKCLLIPCAVQFHARYWTFCRKPFSPFALYIPKTRPEPSGRSTEADYARENIRAEFPASPGGAKEHVAHLHEPAYTRDFQHQRPRAPYHRLASRRSSRLPGRHRARAWRRPKSCKRQARPRSPTLLVTAHGSDGRRSAGGENQFLTLGAPQPALSRLRLANRLRSVQRQSIPGACCGAIYSRPREASPPRDLRGIRRHSQEERHRLRRTLHLVVISFAPDGARAWSGADFPTARAVGYDLSPATRAGVTPPVAPLQQA